MHFTQPFGWFFSFRGYGEGGYLIPAGRVVARPRMSAPSVGAAKLGVAFFLFDVARGSLLEESPL